MSCHVSKEAVASVLSSDKRVLVKPGRWSGFAKSPDDKAQLGARVYCEDWLRTCGGSLSIRMIRAVHPFLGKIHSFGIQSLKDLGPGSHVEQPLPASRTCHSLALRW